MNRSVSSRCTFLLLALMLASLINGDSKFGTETQFWGDWRHFQRKRYSPYSVKNETIVPAGTIRSVNSLNNYGLKEDDNDDKKHHKKVATLNVSSKDSPYALINEFFAEREENYDEKAKKFEEDVMKGWKKPVEDLRPEEVWLSEGGLLVLKGGFTSDDNDESWNPLDDYQAPYREPVLPPVNFIPNDTGVGVPLPPEEEDEVTEPVQETDIKTLPRPTDLFDEEKYISQVENFHSARNAEKYFTSPKVSKLTTKKPVIIKVPEPVPSSPVVTTPAPKHITTSQIPPVVTTGYFVSTSTPNSYSFAFHHKARQFHPSPRITKATTPAPPPVSAPLVETTPRPRLHIAVGDTKLNDESDYYLKVPKEPRIRIKHHKAKKYKKFKKVVGPTNFINAISNEINDEFENRRRSSKAFVVDRTRIDQKRRRVRKPPFHHLTAGRLSNQPPFLHQLRQHIDLDHKRRKHRQWQKDHHGDNAYAGNFQKYVYTRKPTKRNKLPMFPPQFPVFGTSNPPRFASSVRRMGNSYSSFFCGGYDCKSWGYSYRS